MGIETIKIPEIEMPVGAEPMHITVAPLGDEGEYIPERMQGYHHRMCGSWFIEYNPSCALYTCEITIHRNCEIRARGTGETPMTAFNEADSKLPEEVADADSD